MLQELIARLFNLEVLRIQKSELLPNFRKMISLFPKATEVFLGDLGEEQYQKDTIRDRHLFQSPICEGVTPCLIQDLFSFRSPILFTWTLDDWSIRSSALQLRSLFWGMVDNDPIERRVYAGFLVNLGEKQYIGTSVPYFEAKLTQKELSLKNLGTATVINNFDPAQVMGINLIDTICYYSAACSYQDFSFSSTLDCRIFTAAIDNNPLITMKDYTSQSRIFPVFINKKNEKVSSDLLASGLDGERLKHRIWLKSEGMVEEGKGEIRIKRKRKLQKLLWPHD